MPRYSDMRKTQRNASCGHILHQHLFKINFFLLKNHYFLPLLTLSTSLASALCNSCACCCLVCSCTLTTRHSEARCSNTTPASAAAPSPLLSRRISVARYRIVGNIERAPVTQMMKDEETVKEHQYGLFSLINKVVAHLRTKQINRLPV